MATLEEKRRLFATALALQEEGKEAETIALLEQLERIDDTPMVKVLHAIVLPQIYESSELVTVWRNRAIQLLQKLRDAGFSMDLSQSFALPWFSLAYQGMNDLEPQKLLASLYRAPLTRAMSKKAPRVFGERIRVGILSAYFRDGHTIAKLSKGLIAKLNRQEFYVVVFSFNRHDDETSRYIQDEADAFVELPPEPWMARRLIAGQKLDLLYFTDIGMEANSYTLAHSRLAPVQCVTWGHPDTTGISTIDYFISSQLLDTDHGQNHYSEQLVRLPNLAVYYHRPLIPHGKPSRSEFGLPEGFHLYGLPQTLIKLDPKFDLVLQRILRSDPKGILVLLKGNRATWNERIHRRFARNMPDLIDRVIFVERQTYEGFLRLNSLFDVLLDPPLFGGGNTSYEAFAMGIPIVTMPSAFLRGRISYALYTMMEINDCIVDNDSDYVNLAVRLASDQSFNQTVRIKVLLQNHVLFENEAGIRDLEHFFKRVCT